MKKYILGALFAVAGTFAQEQTLEQKVDELKAKSDKFNVFFNFQSSMDAEKKGESDMQTSFKARQLRLEFRGKLSDKLSYRFRHRLNKPNDAKSLDNMAKATDLMYVGYKANDVLTLTLGKQCQAWGGFEFDLNPMNIYEYSDFIENMDNFMLGVNFGFQLSKDHQLNLQVTDTRNDTFDKVYDKPIVDKDGNAVAGITESNTPLTYIINWNGNLLDGKLQTRWAYGLETQAKDKQSNMLTLGTKLNLPKFQLAFDYMRAMQDIDRLGYVSGAKYADAEGNTTKIAQGATYNTFITKVEFQPTKQWNVFAKYMYETGEIKDVEKSRISQGYFVGVEHMPFEGEDCRFFLTYVGRSFDMFGADTNSNRVSIGMMYRIKAF